MCYTRCVLFCRACRCHHRHHVYRHHQRLPCLLVQEYVVHFYDLNTIIVRAMPSCTNASMVQAFTKMITILKSKGYQPALNVMENVCSTTIKKAYTLYIQLVPPHNHCVNTAKQAIATFKEHFIAALTTVDILCPLQLWDDFFPQVELTLNMICFSQKIPTNQPTRRSKVVFQHNTPGPSRNQSTDI